MSNLSLLAFVILSAATCPCVAQQRRSVHECLSALRLPSATGGLPRKWFSKDSETVRIRISFEKEGLFREIHLEGGTAPLRDFTEEWLRKSVFSPSCSGSSVTFEYEYKLYQRPVVMHLPSVTLKAGDVFVLEFLEAPLPSPFIEHVPTVR